MKGNMTNLEKDQLQKDHDIQLQESKTRYDLKSDDTKVIQNKVLSGDLPKVSTYTTFNKQHKFLQKKTLDTQLYNVRFIFPLYDVGRVQMRRGGNEIASCIIKWADLVISLSPVEEITIWSDNCYGQTKNLSLIHI